MTNDTIDATGDDLVTTEWKVGPITWRVFRRELLSTYEGGLRAIATERKMRHHLDLVSALVAVTEDGDPIMAPDGEPVRLVQTTADLTLRTVARLVQTQDPNKSPETIRSLLRDVRVMCNVAVKTGRLRVSPFAIRPLASWVRRQPPKGRRHLSRQELGTLLAALKAGAESGKGWLRWKTHRLYAMAAVASYCGLRAAELYHLHVEDVDVAGRIIQVRPRRTHRLKTESSAAPVPMPRALVPIVQSWLEHRLDPPIFPPADQVPWMWPGARAVGPWIGGCPGTKPLHALQAAASAAGIGHTTWQMLRRSLATHLRAFGVSGAMASQVLRHSEEVDEEFYLQGDLDNLRDAVEDVKF